MRLPDRVLFCGVQYKVRESEGLIVFTEDGGNPGVGTRFAFERHYGCWYVTPCGDGGSVMATHVISAYALISKAYGKNHEFKGTGGL